MSKDLEEFKQKDARQLEELEAFRKQFNVTDKDRFDKAVMFCEKLLEGGTMSAIYADVFGVPIEKARTLAGGFHRNKWVQELLLFLRPDEQSLYFGERKKIIARGMQIINDPSSSNRDVTEAIKALQPYIKQEKMEHELKLNTTATAGQSLNVIIADKIQELAHSGRMIDKSGDVIDMDIIE